MFIQGNSFLLLEAHSLLENHPSGVSVTKEIGVGNEYGKEAVYSAHFSDILTQGVLSAMELISQHRVWEVATIPPAGYPGPPAGGG